MKVAKVFICILWMKPHENSCRRQMRKLRAQREGRQLHSQMRNHGCAEFKGRHFRHTPAYVEIDPRHRFTYIYVWVSCAVFYFPLCVSHWVIMILSMLSISEAFSCTLQPLNNSNIHSIVTMGLDSRSSIWKLQTQSFITNLFLLGANPHCTWKALAPGPSPPHQGQRSPTWRLRLLFTSGLETAICRDRREHTQTAAPGSLSKRNQMSLQVGTQGTDFPPLALSLLWHGIQEKKARELNLPTVVMSIMFPSPIPFLWQKSSNFVLISPLTSGSRPVRRVTVTAESCVLIVKVNERAGLQRGRRTVGDSWVLRQMSWR